MGRTRNEVPSLQWVCSAPDENDLAHGWRCDAATGYGMRESGGYLLICWYKKVYEKEVEQ